MYSGLFTIVQTLIQHMSAQKRARMQGIVKQDPAWKISIKQKKDAFINASI